MLNIRCSARSDGDFHRTKVPMPELEARRRALVDLPWTMLDEHHGTTAVEVDRPGVADGVRGDIAVTDCDGAVLGCWVGDCAPIVLVGTDRRFATVHAGWRGLAAGIVDRAIDALGEPLAGAYLGPVIGPCCYEFGEADLVTVADGAGASPSTISSRTAAGTPALDVPAVVAAACERHGVEIASLGACTGCSPRWYSHRTRLEPQRHVVAAWRPSGSGT